MPAVKSVLPVEFAIVRAVKRGYEVLTRTLIITKRTADYLLHLSVMNINTWSEFHLCFPSKPL